MLKPTEREYSGLQRAYDCFNRELFEGTLPEVLVTLQRQSRTRGYFSPQRFRARTSSDTIHELALNPDHFHDRTDLEILSTLAHEMCHVWQEAHGKPPRRCYHDRQWAEKMKAIGLQPSHNELPGGKETGQKVSHYILKDGRFHSSAARLLNQYSLGWEDATAAPSAEGPKKDQTKVKFTCPDCGLNAWAKGTAHLNCGDCEVRMRSEFEPPSGKA